MANSNSSIVFKKLPGVLSFQRLAIISDGLMFNRHADGRETPLAVIRHGIRGTQNVNGKTPKNVNNIQITESAKTASDANGVVFRFSLGFLPLSRSIFACAGDDAADIRSAIEDYCRRAVGSEGLAEVARRYARNVLNGRWLWRNRLLGQSINISVSVDGESEPRVSQDALASATSNFDGYTTAEETLGELILGMLEGRQNHRLNVQADLDLGFKGSVEVFPSQNYIENKPDGFARPLYKVDVVRPKRASTPSELEDIHVMGQAALRDQKIGNALRTLDTWFDDYAQYGNPIPVEPLGASLDAQRFFREKKTTSFAIMRGVAGLDPSSDDGKFLLASLVRGGVYSESDKKPAGDEAKPETAVSEVVDEA